MVSLRAIAKAGRGGRSRRETWGTDILRERSYVWLVASRLFFLMGGSVLVNYIITYLHQSHGMTQTEANDTNFVLLILVVLGNLIAIVPAARVSDRIGRKPVIYASCVIGFVGVTIAAVAPNVPLALLGRAPVRRVGGHVPRRRLGAHDRHHPEGVVRAVHGPLERRDGIRRPSSRSHRAG